MASSGRFSLEQASALSRPPERAGRVPCDPKAAPRIRVSTIRPSPDVRPLECATFVSSPFFRLRSRSSLSPLDACATRRSLDRADRRSGADGRLFLRLGRLRLWFLTRSSLVAALLASVASLMAMGAPPLPPLHPVGSGGSGRGGGRGSLLCFGLQRLQRRR